MNVRETDIRERYGKSFGFSGLSATELLYLNPKQSWHKVSSVKDRIIFAGRTYSDPWKDVPVLPAADCIVLEKGAKKKIVAEAPGPDAEPEGDGCKAGKGLKRFLKALSETHDEKF